MNIHSPRQLVAALPHMLGFHPAASVVFVVIRNDEVCAALRMDLADAKLLDAVPTGLVAVGEGFDERAVAIVGYGPNSPEIHAVCHSAEAVFESSGWGILDVLMVSDNKWRSLLCDDEECCPDDGQEIEPGSEAVEVELVALGSAPFVSREAMQESLESRSLSTQESAARIEAYNAVFDHVSTDLVRDQIATRTACIKRAFEILTRTNELEWDDIAVVCVVVEDIRMRDGLLRRCFDNRDARGLILERLRQVIRVATAVHVPALSTVLAGVAWLDGNGALAQIGLNRAMDEDPTYTLAQLLTLALSHNVPPDVWASSLDAVSFDQCLAGAA